MRKKLLNNTFLTGQQKKWCPGFVVVHYVRIAQDKSCSQFRVNLTLERTNELDKDVIAKMRKKKGERRNDEHEELRRKDKEEGTKKPLQLFFNHWKP